MQLICTFPSWICSEFQGLLFRFIGRILKSVPVCFKLGIMKNQVHPRSFSGKDTGILWQPYVYPPFRPPRLAKNTAVLDLADWYTRFWNIPRLWNIPFQIRWSSMWSTNSFPPFHNIIPVNLWHVVGSCLVENVVPPMNPSTRDRAHLSPTIHIFIHISSLSSFSCDCSLAWITRRRDVQIDERPGYYQYTNLTLTPTPTMMKDPSLTWQRPKLAGPDYLLGRCMCDVFLLLLGERPHLWSSSWWCREKYRSRHIVRYAQ